MGNFKENIYQLFIGLYRVLPYKKAFCLALKRLNVPRSRFYTDLRFNGEFKVKLSSDASFRLINYGASIENEIFWNGPFVTWENDTGWIWKQLCLSSKVVFDVGANTGLYSLITKSLNPQAKVYAFEPSQNTYHKLSKNDQLNSFGIHCEQIALSNMDGKQVFYDVEDSNQTSASLSPDKLKNWIGHTGRTVEYEVKTMKCSSYIEENHIENIDLIKIDVEMHEAEVIEGLGTYLSKFKPAVVIEVLSESVANDLNKLIDHDDYQIFHLKGHEDAKPVSRFKLIPNEWNFLFFHNDSESWIRKNTNLYEHVSS